MSTRVTATPPPSVSKSSGSAATDTADSARMDLQDRVWQSLTELCKKMDTLDGQPFRLDTSGNVDLSTSFLRNDREYDWFDVDKDGGIVLQPKVPIFPEDFPPGRKEWPLSWWGIVDPFIGEERKEELQSSTGRREDVSDRQRKRSRSSERVSRRSSKRHSSSRSRGRHRRDSPDAYEERNRRPRNSPPEYPRGGRSEIVPPMDARRPPFREDRPPFRDDRPRPPFFEDRPPFPSDDSRRRLDERRSSDRRHPDAHPRMLYDRPRSPIYRRGHLGRHPDERRGRREDRPWYPDHQRNTRPDDN